MAYMTFVDDMSGLEGQGGGGWGGSVGRNEEGRGRNGGGRGVLYTVGRRKSRIEHHTTTFGPRFFFPPVAVLGACDTNAGLGSPCRTKSDPIERGPCREAAYNQKLRCEGESE